MFLFPCVHALLGVSTKVRPPVERGQFWDFQLNSPCFSSIAVHYTTAGPKRTKEVPLVFLPGFGVGEFHFEHNLKKFGEERKCYSFDWIGQGRSWPRNEIEERGLQVGAETWALQLTKFLEDVVGQQAILVGNSLGGYMGAIVASRRPQLVKGLALLNPTPFWGLWSPQGSPIWDGMLPAPEVPGFIGSRWFDALRNEKNVRKMLCAVYADECAADDELVEQICEAAGSEFGPSAFTSILFSATTPESFDDALGAIHDHKIPVGLFYGKDDPWVSPSWGQRAFRRLHCDASYYELSPTGHCPHHEAPSATNLALQDWLGTLDNRDSSSLCAGDHVVVNEGNGRQVTVAKVDGKPRTLMEHAAHAIWH